MLDEQTSPWANLNNGNYTPVGFDPSGVGGGMGFAPGGMGAQTPYPTFQNGAGVGSQGGYEQKQQMGPPQSAQPPDQLGYNPWGLHRGGQ